MTPRRFFVPALSAEGGEVELDPDASRHAHVLRLSTGDRVRLFDGQGSEADAVVTAVRGTVLCHAAAPQVRAEPGPHVSLIQCMPKGNKLETIVRMVTELGVAAIHLAHSARTVARLDGSRAAARLARLERVAQSASRQAGRTHVPPVLPPVSLAVACERAPHDAVRLVPHVASEAALGELSGGAPCWLVIGPEGGLDRAESESLCAAGWQSVTLGPDVLRVETAAAVAVALALDRLRA